MGITRRDFLRGSFTVSALGVLVPLMPALIVPEDSEFRRTIFALDKTMLGWPEGARWETPRGYPGEVVRAAGWTGGAPWAMEFGGAATQLWDGGGLVQSGAVLWLPASRELVRISYEAGRFSLERV